MTIKEMLKEIRDDLQKNIPDTDKPYKDYGAGFKDCRHQVERIIKNKFSLYIKKYVSQINNGRHQSQSRSLKTPREYAK